MKGGSVCACTLGDTGVRRCDAHHRYWDGSTELVSVSRVLYDVLPAKSWDGVDDAVIDYAALRGSTVDRLLCELLETGAATVPLLEGTNPSNGMDLQSEIQGRMKAIIGWWEACSLTPLATQKMLSREGIAGTLDIQAVDNATARGVVIDLKCVSKLQPVYELQLGAYLWLLNGEALDAAILHSTSTAVRFRSYDPVQAITRWQAALEWWKIRQLLK